MACITKRRGRLVLDFYDQFGVRQRETLPKGTTKTKAREELRDREERVSKGMFVSERKAPLFSEVAAEWLEYKKPKVRETTWEVIEGMLRNHFQDLNDRKITRITTADIEKYITARQTEGIHILTLRKILVTLGQIMAYAVRHRYIEHNPYREAEKPRDQRTQEKEFNILTPPEIRALLEAEEDQEHKTLYLLAIMAGPRQGEILGLIWPDLDLKKNQIYIQRTFTKGRFFPTKTKCSKRKIDLSPTVMLELKKWKLACPKAKAKDTEENLYANERFYQATDRHTGKSSYVKGNVINQDPDRYEHITSELDLIFPNEAGQPMNYSNMVQRHFIPALEKAGIIEMEAKKKPEGSKKRIGTKKVKGKKVRFHDLRHTYASLMIEQGENIKYIQTQLGHSSPMVTLNVYAHLMKPTNQEAVLRLESTIFDPTGHNLVTEKEKDLSINA